MLSAGLLLVSCQERMPEPPRPSRVTPEQGRPDIVTPITIKGEGFYPAIRISYDNSGHSYIRTDFQARLGQVELQQVTYIDSNNITAVVPSGMAVGVYDLLLIDPDGRQGSLADAFRIVTDACLTDDDCRDPCRSYSCQDGTCVYGLVDRDRDGDGHIDAACPEGDDCDDDPAGCGSACYPGAREICDGQDNDCDPATADGSADPLLGSSCDGPDSDLCEDDSYDSCQDGVLVCSTGSDDVEGPNGDPSCSDGVDNDCDGQSDAQEPACSDNTPPLVAFMVSPPVVEPGQQFTVDASSSRDREEAVVFLEVRWDWENDGTWDTDFTTTKTATHSFNTVSTHTIALQVRDTGLLSGFTTRTVVVQEVANTLVVTTDQDEDDPGATVQDPGGTGLSLREALDIAAGMSGQQTVTFNGPMTIMLSSSLPSPWDTSGTKVVGMSGVVVDGDNLNNADCIVLASPLNELHYLEITNCSSWAVIVGDDNNLLAHCHVHHNGLGVRITGVDNQVGPGCEIDNHPQEGLDLTARADILGNRLHHNLQGLALAQGADGTVIIGNYFYANNANGVLAANTIDAMVVFNNTFDGNGASGLSLPSQATAIEVQNNLFCNNGGYGIQGEDGNFTACDHNGFFSNGGGNCSACSIDATSILANPLYIDRGTFDFRLWPQSPMIDAGVDLGIDINGPAQGNFNGSAPDVGAWESP